jgi:hypothetical protein
MDDCLEKRRRWKKKWLSKFVDHLRRRDVWSVHDFGLSKYMQAEELLVERV